MPGTRSRPTSRVNFRRRFAPSFTRCGGSVDTRRRARGRRRDHAPVVRQHRVDANAPAANSAGLPRRAARAARHRSPSRRMASRSEWSSSRMSMATVTGSLSAVRSPLSALRGPRVAAARRTLHVRGSSDGTSVKCARSMMMVGRPAARARSHGPDISRAVGQRRFSDTSHAPRCAVSSSSLSMYPVIVTWASSPRARTSPHEVVVPRRRRPASSRCARGRRRRAACCERVEDLRDALFGREPTDDAEHDRIGRDPSIGREPARAASAARSGAHEFVRARAGSSQWRRPEHRRAAGRPSRRACTAVRRDAATTSRVIGQRVVEVVVEAGNRQFGHVGDSRPGDWRANSTR